MNIKQKRVSETSTAVLNDPDSLSREAKAFHMMNARNEAENIYRRYQKQGAKLHLVCKYLSQLATEDIKKYSMPKEITQEERHGAEQEAWANLSRETE